MTLIPWLQGGVPLMDGAGVPLLCEDCPCEANDCNACSPPIPDTLYVTLATLLGDLAPYNTKHTLDWNSGCHWVSSNYPSTPYVDASYITAAGSPSGYAHWRVQVIHAGSCFKSWNSESYDGGLPDKPCDPFSQTCSAYACQDGGCSDGNTCADSAGATCVVSLT